MEAQAQAQLQSNDERALYKMAVRLYMQRIFEVDGVEIDIEEAKDKVNQMLAAERKMEQLDRRDDTFKLSGDAQTSTYLQIQETAADDIAFTYLVADNDTGLASTHDQHYLTKPEAREIAQAITELL